MRDVKKVKGLLMVALLIGFTLYSANSGEAQKPEFDQWSSARMQSEIMEVQRRLDVMEGQVQIQTERLDRVEQSMDSINDRLDTILEEVRTRCGTPANDTLSSQGTARVVRTVSQSCEGATGWSSYSSPTYTGSSYSYSPSYSSYSPSFSYGGGSMYGSCPTCQ